MNKALLELQRVQKIDAFNVNDYVKRKNINQYIDINEKINKELSLYILNEYNLKYDRHLTEKSKNAFTNSEKVNRDLTNFVNISEHTDYLIFKTKD